MTISLQPVVMAGGSGTRLWPLSRAGFPKQFLALDGRSSLFQQAVQRLAAIGNDAIQAAPPLVVGNEEHRFLLLEQLRELGIVASALLLEPAGRNTAPALTLAALAALDGGGDPVLAMTPADQTVADGAAFTAAMRRAVALAEAGAIVTLGVVPTRPETGYGYIHAASGADSAAVRAFVEKPDLATAQRYLREGSYLWNAGIFVLKASVWLAALERFAADIAGATRLAWQGRTRDAGFVRPARDAFARVRAESIDYAVMERCPGSGLDMQVVPLDAGWNDLGAWDAVWQMLPKDAAGNATMGDVLVDDCRDTLVHASSRLVAAVGLHGAVVVETPDAVLVSSRERSQDVKRIVERLAADGRDEKNLHRKVHRPWGWYDSIDSGSRFQVKRIMVKPGASLSLQMHHHRAEHWIVVQGTAEVTCGERKLMLSENQSTYIPLGEVHRLANPGKVPLEIIEVQSGSYLGEDDIVRFEDSYGRTDSAG
ncbi:MAG: mannose-1-phosphate guanylyltransferase/mannose-6-phosphate isomerase [Ideonella sp.]|nr:mannose-1-phosphate guanylyltransferase/mannose-6-phosphate isomerase [Ideonella sp.]MCC7455538.1 mannose-1-phosphate guanylyltransferase/mannose-6-phosphate isomerase [Nitrospira sp.]